MTPEAHGEVKAAFPATSKGVYGEVRKIMVCQNPASTGVVLIQANGVTIRAFNTPNATGALEQPFHIGGEGDQLDPTQYSIVPDAGGHGAFVTYWIA